MRKAVVLYMTLGVILLIGSAVLLLLRTESRFKESVEKEAAYVQGTLFIRDMSEYLLSNALTPEEIFGGAGIPVAMALDSMEGTVTIYSAQRKIDLNTYLKHLGTDQRAYEAFLNWLAQKGYKNPSFLLALLLDTLDKDLNERVTGSELRLKDPRFQNGAVFPKRSLPAIFRAYRQHTRDRNATARPFDENFGFDPFSFDLNYATLDQLILLYPDFPRDQLTRVAAHDTFYKSADDLPLPPDLRRKILAPRFGITPTLKTQTLEVVIDYTYHREWQSRISFYLATGKKAKVYHLTFQPLVPIENRQGETP
ncbi:MAG: hypothetical protein GXO33_05710 [Epsilonproteobacteria bacterium]|nr:hypothetical protein [Campylobacterota bacterium]